MKKRVMLISCIFILIIFSFTALADGCFTNSESPFNCFDMAVEQAVQECSLLKECDLKSDFHEDVECKTLSVCGKGGAVSKENTGSLSEQDEKINISSEIQKDLESKTNQELNEGQEESEDKEGSSFLFWFVIIVLLIVIIYFVAKSSIFKEIINKIVPAPPRRKQKLNPLPFSPFNISPFRRYKINRMKKKRKDKIKRHQRKAILNEPGFPIDKVIQEKHQKEKIKSLIHTKKLEKHLEEHQKKKGYQNLDEFLDKTKKK